MIELLLYYFGFKKCYNSIDELPIYYWFKIQDTGNLSFLFRFSEITVHSKRPSKGMEIILSKLWRKLNDEFISKFNFPDTLIKLQRLRVEISLLHLDLLATGNKTINTFIKIKEAEMENYSKHLPKGMTLAQCILMLNKHNYRINEFRTSVTMFYSAIDELKNEIKTANNG